MMIASNSAFAMSSSAEVETSFEIADMIAKERKPPTQHWRNIVLNCAW